MVLSKNELTRRSALIAAMWATPVMAVALAVPAEAASAAFPVIVFSAAPVQDATVGTTILYFTNTGTADYVGDFNVKAPVFLYPLPQGPTLKVNGVTIPRSPLLESGKLFSLYKITGLSVPAGQSIPVEVIWAPGATSPYAFVPVTAVSLDQTLLFSIQGTPELHVPTP